MQAGRIKFTIERNKSGLNKLTPSYNLFLEKSPGNKILVLYGKKRAFNKTTNFLISLSKDANGRESNMCVGKLRANKERNKFTLYDNGENYQKLSTF
jgi:N-glycosylase/DNA lyase